MTKSRFNKRLEDLEAFSRYITAAMQATGFLETTPDGQKGFVNPAFFSHLPVLKRGFLGRFKWLLSGK